MNDFPQLELIVTQERIRAYAALSGDSNPIHLDPAFAATTRFGKPIAHGTMALNLLVRACARHFGGTGLWPAGMMLQTRFIAPVHVGATLRTNGARSSEEEWALGVTADGLQVIAGRVWRKHAL